MTVPPLLFFFFFLIQSLIDVFPPLIICYTFGALIGVRVNEFPSMHV